MKLGELVNRKRICRRSAGLFLIFAVLTSALCFRLGYLQLWSKARYTNLAEAQRLQPELIDPQRGNIYDRNYELLARSVDAYSIHVIPVSGRDPRAAAELLAPYLDMSADEIETLLVENDAKQRNFWLARKLSLEAANAIRELNIPGIRLITRPQRFYPQGSLAAHVIGIAGIDNQGLEGIEYQYDDLLKGTPGTLKVEKDAVQRRIPGGLEDMVPPVNGWDLVLTLDAAVQFIAEKELQSAVSASKSSAGIILVMDPNTGAILANAVYPTFDPNNYQAYPTAHRRNIAVTDLYEPGSTFKIFTAAAALDLGIVDANRQFYSGPSWDVGGGTVRSSNIYGNRNITFLEAIERSDNIVFAQLSVEMGPERFYPYLAGFGYGKKTGVGFPGEAAGILPKPGQVVYGETLRWANIGFGQGIAVTPLQLLTAVSAVANGGKLMKPYYVAEIRDEYGKIIKRTEPEVVSQPIAFETSKILTEFLISAVNNGSGSRARIIGFEVAGKTGTAEVPEQGGYGEERIASFVGFAPADNPRVAVLVVLYQPQTEVRYGGVLAAPVFQTVTEKVLEYLGVTRRQAAAQSSQMVIVPNVQNYPAAEAEKILKENKLTANPLNEGQIVRDQIPSPGSRVLPQTAVNLLFYEETEPIMVTVPNLIGKSMRDASTLVSEIGLQFRPKGSGIAVRQNPAVGARVPIGSVIEVEFQP
ncbi:MAG: penicillin-binding transpeptidase domain-containing protein [Limnochordia bacterium]